MVVYGVSRLGIANFTIMEPGEPIMLYVSIDRHRKQLPDSVRDDAGNVVLISHYTMGRIPSLFGALGELSHEDS